MPDTSKNSLWITLAITLLCYPFAKLLFFPALILNGIHLWIHEFGHSTIAWLGGIAATPLPFGWSNLGEDRSVLVHLSFIFLLGVMGYRSFQSKNYYWFFVAIALFALKLNFSLALSLERLQIAIVWGGIGGEFFFSTFLWLSTFYPFLEDRYWPSVKAILLLGSSYALMSSTVLWLKISKGKADIPFGSLLHGGEDSGGDMNQLLDMAGWTKGEIIRSYLSAMNICWFIVIVHFIAFAIYALTRPKPISRLAMPPNFNRRTGK